MVDTSHDPHGGEEGMSTGAKVGLGVAGLAGAGALGYALSKGKIRLPKFGKPTLSNYSHKRAVVKSTYNVDKVSPKNMSEHLSDMARRTDDILNEPSANTYYEHNPGFKPGGGYHTKRTDVTAEGYKHGKSYSYRVQRDNGMLPGLPNLNKQASYFMNKYLEKIAELNKEASAWGAVGRVIQKAGKGLGARSPLKTGQMGPAAPKGISDHIYEFGKNVRSGRGHARLALGATGAALATGVAAGMSSKSNGQ